MGSIPDEVSQLHYDRSVDSVSNRNEYQDIFWGGGGFGGAPRGVRG
jgi:hypothetical protein